MVEASGSNPLTQSMLVWKFADAFRQVLIGLCITSDSGTELWQNGKGVAVVEVGQKGQHNLAKFQAKELASGSKNAPRFAKGVINVSDIA